jgi:hypothetical protein
MMANPVVLIIMGIIAAIIALGFAISAIIKNFDAIWAGIKNIIRAVCNFFANIGIGIANIFIDAVNFCVDILNALLTPLDEIVKLFGGEGVQIPHWNVDIQYDPIKEFALGGMPDKGTLFIAGEAGAEIVSTSSSGQTGVSNVQQIAQATYQGTMSALRDWWGGQNARGDIPKLTEANATGMYQAVTGVANSYGKTWSNV